MRDTDHTALLGADLQSLSEFLRMAYPEDERLDYKRDMTGDFSKTVAAMANSDGGVIVFGVDEDKKTKSPKTSNGVAVADPRGAFANQLRDLLDPRPSVRTSVIPIDEERVFIVVVVDPSLGRVVLHRDHGVLVRHHDQSVPPTRSDFDSLVRRQNAALSNEKSANLSPGRRVRSARDDLHVIYDRLDYLHAHRSASSTVRPLEPWPRLEKAVGGFPIASVMLVLGESAVGKSSLATNLAVRVALEQKGRVLFVTTGSTTNEVVRRALSVRSGIPAFRLAGGDLEELDYVRLAPAMNDIADSRFSLIESEVDLEDILRDTDPEDAPDLLIIDAIEAAELGRPNGQPGPLERLQVYRSIAPSRGSRVLLTLEPSRFGDGGVPSSSGPSELVRQVDVAITLIARPSPEVDHPWALVEARLLKAARRTNEPLWLAFNRNTSRMAEVASEGLDLADIAR